jgi:hypothetical protein
MKKVLVAATLVALIAGPAMAQSTFVTKSDGVGCFEQEMLGVMISRFKAGSFHPADTLGRCIRMVAGTSVTTEADDMAASDDAVPGGVILRVRVNGRPIWISATMLLSGE